MGFWSKIWKKKKYQENGADDWENIVYDRDTVNFREEEERTRYIANCLEQISEADRELSLLSGEYNRVTSYLTDMEEIEALPEEDRKELNEIAGRFARLKQERQRYRGKKNRMSDSDYYRMRKQEDELQEGIAKLKECEEYGAKIRQDLQRLDRERHAYEFRRQELDAIMNNMRGMMMIFLTAFATCVVMLLILQFGFEMDTKAGYLVAVAAVAVAVTVVWVKYTDGENELHRVELAVNKLILLQNRVKIRYVNNKNLIDYLYIKYGTESAAALEKLWKQYQEEKDERREYAETEAKADYYQKQLLNRISNYRVASPERWIGHPEALLDKREMVEMRHELILQRQSLRKQMDYNNNVGDTARNEIIDIIDRYPDYADEIREMVERYKGEESDY